VKKIFGLEKNIFFLGLVSFLNDFSSEMVFSVMPAFFISVLKTGAGALGLTEGIAEAASNFMKIYSGRTSDLLQKRKIFAVVGYSLSVATRPFYVFAGSVGAVVGLRLTDRIGKGLRDAPRDALIALSTPHATSGRSFGYHRAMDTLGGILGPLTAYFILSAYPHAFNTVFVTAFVIGVAAVASISFVKEVGATMLTGNSDSNKLSKKVIFYLVSVFILSMGTLPVILILLKTQDLGIPASVIPLFYAFYSVTFTLFSLPAGGMADKVHSAPVITVGYLFLIVAYTAFVFSSSIFSFVAGLLALGMFSAFTDGVQRSHLSHLVGVSQKGTGYGYLNAAAGLGALVAGAGGGYLWQAYGAATALGAAGVITFVGLAVFLIGGDGHTESAILKQNL
jgi:MFS family permease